MLHHTAINVIDLDNSRKFYEKLFNILGFKLLNTAYDWYGYGNDYPFIFIGSKSPHSVNHVVFTGENQLIVDEFYNTAIALGATCNGPPKVRNDFFLEYYGAFFKDLDGNSIGIISKE